MITSVFDATVFAVIGKVALVSPAGTVMLDGTVATSNFDVPSWTGTPPGRAARSSVAVPVAVPPPPTVDGLTVIDASGIFSTETDGFTVNRPLPLDEPKDAVIRTLAVVDRALVVKLNIELVSPAKIVCVAG
jgi:hypothetical protein